MNRWRCGALAGIGTAVSLAACGSSGSPQSAPEAPTSASASTVALPTASAVPSSSAAAPSSPVCGPAGAVAQQMGMKNITVYTAVTDPNHLLGRQGEYTSKVEWSADGEISGIEAFADAPDAQLRYAYLRAFRPPIGDGYDYLYRAAILRLASVYTPAQAEALDASFERACRESS
jgi:hypothetical protein